MGRLLVFLLLGLLAAWSVMASSHGSGARSVVSSPTPVDARAAHERFLEEQRLAAEAAERRRRYQAGEMTAAERIAYEAELEAERQRRAAEAERARQAAYARSVRGTRVSGGGPSSGK